MKQLPSSWVRVSLSDIGLLHPPSVIPSRWPEKKWELWSVPSFPTGQPERLFGSEIGSNKQLVAPFDVLLCKINPRINRVWKVESAKDLDQIASTEWIVFRCPALDPDYLVYLLSEPGFRSRLCADVSGVGGSLTRARPKIVTTIEVALAPRAEQTRIADKITTLDTHSRAARKHLDAIPPLLEQFRASVLSAAFSGRLTADWRAEQKRKGVKIETADALLERMRIERRQRWEEDQLARMKAKGEKPKDDSWKKKYKVPEPLDVARLSPPSMWKSVSLGELCAGFDYGSSAKSQRQGRIPVLRMGNLQRGEIDWTDLVFTTNKSEIAHYELEPGTVLFNRTNSPELVGKTAIYRGEKPAIFAGYLIRCRELSGLDPEYLNFVLNADFSRQHCLRVKSDAVSQSNINATKLAGFEVPLCSLAEQREIVKRVSELLARGRNIESETEAAAKQETLLTQSILAKAFRGELVPQDPNDEPATELLKRITEEKEND
jgi:type I restriction enzyme, S subunit